MNGGTVVRPVFFEFPQDTVAQTLSYQFMWGSALIIAPVINPVSFSFLINFWLFGKFLDLDTIL